MKKKFYLAGSILSVASVVPFAVACSGGQKKDEESKAANLQLKIDKQKEIINNLKDRIGDIEKEVERNNQLLQNHIINSQDAFKKLVEAYNQIKNSTKLKNLNNQEITITTIEEIDLTFNAEKLQERTNKILSAIQEYTNALGTAISEYKEKVSELNAELADKTKIIDNAKEDLDSLKNKFKKFKEEFLDKINQPKTADQTSIDQFINEKIKTGWNDSFTRKITTTKTYEAILGELKSDISSALTSLKIGPIVSADKTINIEYIIARQRSKEFIEINIKISKGVAINSLYNILINQFATS